MGNLYILIWEVCIFICVFGLMFFALQKIDYSKIFKPNSTLAIRIIILFVSMAVAFGVSLGIGEIMKLISSL